MSEVVEESTRRLIEGLRALDSEERMEVFCMIKSQFCVDCGDEGDTGTCPCHDRGD